MKDYTDILLRYTLCIDPEPDQCSKPGVQVPQKVSFHVQPRGLEL